LQANQHCLNQNYPSSVRLQHPSEFKRSLTGKRISRGALFVIHVPKTQNTHQKTARLGIIVGKRFARKAVTRNTIKRIIREQFRLSQHQLPAVDIVIRLHRSVPELSLTQLKRKVSKELFWHFKKIADHFAKSSSC